jgi:membrane-associated phospholipid phosphatase
MTVITAVVCYVYEVRMRTTAAVLGGIVIVSTFVLGIHWIPDMIAGAAVGTISVMAARRLCQWWNRRKFPLTLTQGQG